MNEKLKTARKILILGEAGRGKTTLARKFSEKLNISSYSTDDFYWKTKFTEKQDKQISIDQINRVYKNDEWIVEGATEHLTQMGYEEADLIIYLAFRTIFSQWWQIIKRHRTRDNETFLDLIGLLRHVFIKRYGLSYKKGDPKILDLVKPYKDKLIILYSYKQIDNFLNKL